MDLAKAEAAAIAAEVKRVVLFAAIAIAVVILAGILAVIGTSLFLAEWLLGSLGWGVLHGVLLFIAIAIACGLAAVGVSGGRIARAFIVGVLFAVAVGLLMIRDGGADATAAPASIVVVQHWVEELERLLPAK